MTEDDVRFHCAHCDFVTKARSIFELAEHVNESHPEQTFWCGRSSGAPTGKYGVFGDLKHCWMKEANGDRTCVYCGSLSEDDFLDIMTHYVAREEGYHFEHSDKNYKVYANRPGVKNAGDGGIKFYKVHVDESHPGIEQRKALFDQAMAESKRRFEEWKAGLRGNAHP